MDFFDPETTTAAKANAADFLARIFAQFEYGGPLVDFGMVFLLINTDLGECAVGCYPVEGVITRVSVTAPRSGTRHMTTADAIQFLRANGAKSDWVKR